MSFEAYSVAIRLRLLDSVSAGLISMASHFGAFNRHVNASQAGLNDLEKRLNRIKMMGLVGGAAVGVGGAMLYSLKGPLNEAKAWAQESAKFASLGFGDKVNADAQKFAAGMKTYGTSATENLTLLSDAMAVFKDLGNARMAAPVLAQMKFGNEAVFGEGGKANESKFMDMLKVIEMRRGLSSPAEFARQANFVQKVIAGSRGRVDATAMLQALKTGGVAVSNMGNDDFYLGSEGLIQEFGGSRYGTAMMSIYQNLVQGRTTASASAELMRLGLLDKKGVIYDTMGRVKKFKPGAFTGTGLYNEGRQNPLNLLSEVLLPAFAAHGITSESGILLELGQILTNRTGSSLLARAFQQSPTLRNQWAANRSAQDIGQLVATGQNTPAGKLIELQAKWKDVLRELGNTVLPIAIKAVEGLTSIVRGILSFTRQFPTATKVLMLAFTGLAGLMVVGGAGMLIAAGFNAIGLALVVGKGLSLGAQLLNVAEGFGAVASRLGKLGVLGLAGAAGYGLGTLLNKLGPDGDLGGWIGGKIYQATHSDYLPSGAAKSSTNKAGDVYLDGHLVGKHLFPMAGAEANRPQTGIGTFDSTQGLIPAGGIY
jgi:hypothetical protein